MRQLPPLNAIKGFEAVVRLGNHKAAAAELGVTHGAISRQIRVLEDYFGCKLFETRGRGLEPTDLARFFAAEARATLDRLSLATQRVREPAIARQVRISATSSVMMHWLMPRLPDFRALHPSIEVTLSASRDPFEKLVSRNDVILRRHPMVHDRHTCHALFRDRRILVCAPGFLENQKIERPEDVLSSTMLLPDGRTEAGAWERWISAHGIHADKRGNRIKFDHVFVLIEAVLNGLGFALLSRVLLETYLEEGRLVEPFPELDMPYPNLFALAPPEDNCTPSVRRFLRWLKAEGEKISGPMEFVEAPVDLQPQTEDRSLLGMP